MLDRILAGVLYLLAIIGFAGSLYFKKEVQISIELPFIILGLAKLHEINSKIKE